MGRPKKSSTGAAPTRERIFDRALELFAERGYAAVSVRDITRSLGLNEATLYIHFCNKAALLDAILARLAESLIEPGFRVPSADYFAGLEEFDLGEFLSEGARRFFERADRRTRLTWRMLMINQYGYASARTTLEEHLLNAPIRFFTSVFENLRSSGRIGAAVDCGSAARITSALFFEYSFRANLSAAWNEPADEAFERLGGDLRMLARWIDRESTE